MMKFCIAVLLLVHLPTSVATTCDACKSTYATDKGAATDDPGRCAAIATYLTCLETSAKTDAGCPLATADAAAIEADYGTASCSKDAKFTATCICQKDFWKTDQSANTAAICSAAKAYILCLKGETTVACDTTSTVVTLATGVETRITGLGTTDCPVSDSCQCQINTAKATVATNANKCTAYKTELSCLQTAEAVGCDGSTTKSAIATATDASRAALSTADCAAVSDSCQCQINTAKATVATNANKCTAYNTELNCLRTAQAAGCDGSTTKSAIATATDTSRAALPTADCAAPTSTCQCEINAAKGDAASSATYCTVLSTLKTCLSAITTGTEAGCTTTTQAALLTDTDTKTSTAKCAADHVTFVMTSLIVSVLLHLFL